jgi:oxygen-independent coproporphyrinogen III oxidase
MNSDPKLVHLTSKYDLNNVSGYLSYPPIGKWNDPITDAEVLDIFGREKLSPEGTYLYFHFPYCETLCYYCICYMKVTADPNTRYDKYLVALDQELALKIDCGGSNPSFPVREMHWGGGTPTYMNCRQIERAFRSIEKRVKFASEATLSLEAYPDARTLSDEKVQLLASLGFTQISFGIESLDPKVLEAINRRQDACSIGHWIDQAHQHGLGVHVDLVYGLPYQTPENFLETIDTVLRFQPDRLATFSFMYTPFTVKHQRVIPYSSVPNSEARFRLYNLLGETAAAHGYTRIGTDHWIRSKTDPLQRAQGGVTYNFQGYEPLSRESVLGFGSSAVSFAQNRYFQNLTSINDYLRTLSAGHLAIIRERSAVLSPDDQIRHRVILRHVLSDLAIDKICFERDFGVAFDTYFSDALPQLDDMERDGLVRGVRSARIEVTTIGMAFIRKIANLFDRYRPTSTVSVQRGTELAS